MFSVVSCSRPRRGGLRWENITKPIVNIFPRDDRTVIEAVSSQASSPVFAALVCVRLSPPACAPVLHAQAQVLPRRGLHLAQESPRCHSLLLSRFQRPALVRPIPRQRG